MFDKIITLCILIFLSINIAKAETVTLKSNTVLVVKNNQEISEAFPRIPNFFRGFPIIPSFFRRFPRISNFFRGFPRIPNLFWRIP